MNRQTKINVLAKHFENFNERMNGDFLFAQVIQLMVDGGHDVYQIIDMLIQGQNELMGIVGEGNGLHKED